MLWTLNVNDSDLCVICLCVFILFSSGALFLLCFREAPLRDGLEIREQRKLLECGGGSAPRAEPCVRRADRWLSEASGLQSSLSSFAASFSHLQRGRVLREPVQRTWLCPRLPFLGGPRHPAPLPLLQGEDRVERALWKVRVTTQLLTGPERPPARRQRCHRWGSEGGARRKDGQSP